MPWFPGTGRSSSLDDLPNVYSQMVRSLVTGQPMVTGGGTTDLLLVGPIADINEALFFLDYLRPLAIYDDTITVSATRQPDFGVGTSL